MNLIKKNNGAVNLIAIDFLYNAYEFNQRINEMRLEYSIEMRIGSWKINDVHTSKQNADMRC